VKPKAIVLEDDVVLNLKSYHTTTLYAGFLIARVEQEERMAEISIQSQSSNLADELAEGMEGMNMD
jgi:hypothetical protein